MNTESNFGYPLCSVFCAVVIYVLSVEPALSLSGSNTYFQKEPVRTIWSPVLALDNTAAGPVYRAYLKLWHVPEPACIW